jgi:hypothetical protein
MGKPEENDVYIKVTFTVLLPILVLKTGHVF